MTAVDDLSFEVAQGEFFGFLGPNGAGKTTTINAIVGLATIQGGSIGMFGHDVITDYRAHVAHRLSPQEYNFDRLLTIEEILIFQAGYYGVPSAMANAAHRGTARPVRTHRQAARRHSNSPVE